jgi:hypothetical protein
VANWWCGKIFLGGGIDAQIIFKWCDVSNFDKCVFVESHIGQLLGRTGLY